MGYDVNHPKNDNEYLLSNVVAKATSAIDFDEGDKIDESCGYQ